MEERTASAKLIQFIEDPHLQPFPLARFLGEMSDTKNRKKNSPAKATHEKQNLSPGKQPPMNLDVVHDKSFVESPPRQNHAISVPDCSALETRGAKQPEASSQRLIRVSGLRPLTSPMPR
jgi:hypothetical protein